MPLKTSQPSVQEVLERMTRELTAFITDEMEQRVRATLRARGKSAQRSQTQPMTDEPRRGRLPVADERSTHIRREVAVLSKPPSVVERKRAVSVKASPAAIKRQPSVQVAASLADRKLPPKQARTLDMNCRVEGCGNRSRGPRMGFICDSHRALLLPEQQRRGREDYRGRGILAAAASESPRGTTPSINAVALADPAPASLSAVVVAPAAQPDPVELPAGNGPAPAGTDYVLTIERARVVTPPKLGPTIEVKFAVARGPNVGRVARGRFPLAGRGLAILIKAALVKPVDLAAPDTLVRLVGTHVLADVIASGNPPGTLAIVKNIRPSAPSLPGSFPRQ